MLPIITLFQKKRKDAMKPIFLTALFTLKPVRRCISKQPQFPAQPGAARETTVLADQMDASRSLTICLGYEPESLYRYAAQSQAAREVLQAIYDGPFDESGGEITPVILTEVPAFTTTPVQRASRPDSGEQPGRSRQPASRHAGLPQRLQQRRLRSHVGRQQPAAIGPAQPAIYPAAELKWSDGETLSAADSVYSYNLAANPATPATQSEKILVEQTANYQALDEQTVAWVGLPGLVSDRSQGLFWPPLPRHAWGELSAADLLQADAANRSPLGWGAYVLDEWQSGEYIRLVKNPNYFRADEGLPQFDTLTFKITVHTATPTWPT